MWLLALHCAAATAVAAAASPAPPLPLPPHGAGSVAAVAALIERVLPGASAHFALALAPASACGDGSAACFALSDAPGGAVAVAGTTASELAAGVGHYLRELCNLTIGWPRGGGSNVFTPAAWPAIGAAPIARARAAPWSYMENVCTHSYSLVWYDWPAWEAFIDWQALSGINIVLAMTGQEEVQYKVFAALGLDDLTIRSWFNGPAFLTWSRGQNENGNNIGGPLPRSWMRAQWAMQQLILRRYRELAITPQLPAFQGVVPLALAALRNDTNMTTQCYSPPCETGFMWSTDPLFATVADAWMQTLCADFNCSDHWYQLDGYFNGGTAPWVRPPHFARRGARQRGSNPVGPGTSAPSGNGVGVGVGVGVGGEGGGSSSGSGGGDGGGSGGGGGGGGSGGSNSGSDGSVAPTALAAPGAPARWQALAAVAEAAAALTAPACEWSAVLPNSYVQNCASEPPDAKCRNFSSVALAMAACDADEGCGGITSQGNGAAPWETRAGPAVKSSPNGESSYAITNLAACHPPPPVVPDPVWRERGAAAYAGVARTDPDAVWSFQGWAIIYWDSAEQASAFRGFVDSVPKGRFVVIDMSEDGCGGWYSPDSAAAPSDCKGEWSKWGDASFFGAPFIWTSLHNFGGTDGLKGALQKAAELPFAGLAAAGGANTSAIGSGFTSEGIDQNPIFYELLVENNFRAVPVANTTAFAVERAHRRYGLVEPSADVALAWLLLAQSPANYDGFGTGVWDETGISHLPAGASEFGSDRSTPSAGLCMTWAAWAALQRAAEAADAAGLLREPQRYDLVNTAREVLAQLSSPMSTNFSDAFSASPLDAARLAATGEPYLALLDDADELLGTDAAFLLGSWLAAARAWGEGEGAAEDCFLHDASQPMPCADFYEWNARAQLTTWKPCLEPACNIMFDKYTAVDYAAKHWNGLVKSYYRARAEQVLLQALEDAAAGRPLDGAAVAAREAALAYAFQRDLGNGFPTEPVGDAVEVSGRVRAKYASFFAACGPV